MLDESEITAPIILDVEVAFFGMIFWLFLLIVYFPQLQKANQHMQTLLSLKSQSEISDENDDGEIELEIEQERHLLLQSMNDGGDDDSDDDIEFLPPVAEVVAVAAEVPEVVVEQQPVVHKGVVKMRNSKVRRTSCFLFSCLNRFLSGSNQASARDVRVVGRWSVACT